VSGLGLTSMATAMPSVRMPHPDQENRIFVGGIPYYLTEEQVRGQTAQGLVGSIICGLYVYLACSGVHLGWVDDNSDNQRRKRKLLSRVD
jgi:hypothetical protein